MLIALRRLSLVATAGFCLLPGFARAATTPVDVAPLKIVLTPSEDKPKGELKALKKACSNLGKALTAGMGPFGVGAFNGYACYRGDKLVDGKEKATPWTLTIANGEKEASLTLTYGAGEESVEVNKVTMPSSPALLEFFKDDEFVDVMAYAVMSGSPMGMALTTKHVKGSTMKVRYWRAGTASGFKFDVPKPAENLTVYKLSYDTSAKLWRSDVVGTAKKAAVHDPKKKKKGDSSVLVGGSVDYTLDADAKAAVGNGQLWVQNSEGLDANEKELDETVKNAQVKMDAAAGKGDLNEFLKKGGDKDLLTHLLDTAASGYVGMRYGFEVIPGVGELGKLLNKTHVFGLLLEFRGGPLEGLRYYYDLLPKTKTTLNGTNGPVEASIEFSRHVLGYSFEFKPGFLVDAITVTPKLGLWTFNASLPTVFDDNGNVQQLNDFNLGHTLSLALEAGLEERSDWYTLRAYYALNAGFALIKTGGKITSNALGIDAFFTAGPTFPIGGVPFRTALLAFYEFENTSLTNGTGTVPANETAISGIGYEAGYAGAGLVITW